MNAISRDTSRIMKCYAILSIALHNYIHLLDPFVKENEMSFSLSRSSLFFDKVATPDWSIIGDLFSFIGWFGVPVFVFLSGYGLSVKYASEPTVPVKPYIKHSFLKLFKLMLPAVVFYLLFSLYVGEYHRIPDGLISLTLLNNLVYPLVPFFPNVYWYFGMTFQLYLVFLLVKKCKKVSSLVVFMVLFTCLLAVWSPGLFDDQNALVWSRHNSIGWMPQFLLGAICARTKMSERQQYQFPMLLMALTMIVSFGLVLVLNMNYYLWILVPYFAIVFFYSLARLTERSELLRKVTIWVGGYSAYIFVVHPIARTVMAVLSLDIPVIIQIVLYVALFMVGAVLYKFLFNRKINLHLNWNKG